MTPLAHAQTNTLNQSNITAFINKTTKLTTGNIDNLSSNKTIEYLEKHLHKNSHFKTTMRYNIPGYPTQENTVSINKKEFINKIRQSTNTISEYKNEVDILQIKISKNKQSATVETRSKENTTMPITHDAGSNDIPIEGTSLCRQILKLSKKGIIQMYNVNCLTDIEFDSGRF